VLRVWLEQSGEVSHDDGEYVCVVMYVSMCVYMHVLMYTVLRVWLEQGEKLSHDEGGYVCVCLCM
jgi:hypothetical protein